MYDRDMPLIAAHGLSNADGLVDVITFVLCTIQQPLQSVANQMDDIRIHGDRSKYLFGSKRDGYRYACEHKHVLFAAVTEAMRQRDVVGAVDVLSLIPGLGIVKASFVAQCLGFEASCLDTHNLRRLGLPEGSFKLGKGVKPDTKRRKIADYLAACATHGSPSYWWDTWCEFVAGSKFNKRLPTADAVSAFHVSAIIR